MKTFRIAALALAVAGVFATEAKAGSTTNDWWNVTFDDKLAEYMPDDPAGAMVALTNLYRAPDGQVVSVQTWDEGRWTTLDGDETTVTNEFNPTNLQGKAYGNSTCLKLDTQGNDLTWQVDPTNTMADTLTALVDADLYLVGSDSPPDAADFDAANDVQAAVYLKNETNEDTGETTNSVLCVYVYDSTTEANYWQELKGVKLYDNSWASVKVVVDHAKVIDPQNSYPSVQVFVNGVKMTARDGGADYWTAANAAKSQTAGRVSSVAFRGTGAVDNFVGKTVETTFDKFDFTAEVYMNGTLVETGDEGNVTRVLQNVEAGAGKVAKFEDFKYHNFEDADNPATYALSKVEIIDLSSGETTTLQYGYNREIAQIVPPENHPDDIVKFATDTAEDDEGVEFEFFTGPFTVNASTAGATEDSTVVKIYFENLPEPGQFKLTASQNVGSAPPTQIFNVNDENLPAFATFTFAETITSGGKSYILSKIKPGTAPTADPITMEYESPSAVVTVPLSTEITGTLYNVATATYVEGTLGDKVLGYEWDADNGEWSFTAKDKPVALRITVADNVATTNEYPSLRAAIAAAEAGETVYLVADDRVSFSADALEIEIDKALTIDGGSNTLFGVSGYSAGGYHDIFVVGSGALTIKDLKFSEFGDTATSFQYETYPIVTSGNYTGQLTLDGVTIDKFARTAVNLNGGTVLITNCTFTADPTAYYQTGVETLNAVVTVVDTTIAGVNSNITGEDPEGAAVFTLKGHDGHTGTGSITVLSGDYTGQFIVAAEALATGSAILSNGTFVATAPAAESAFLLDAGTVTVAGGWYDREPEAKYIAAGLSAVDYGAEAPDARATWTVEGEMVTVTWVITEASSNMVRVAKGSEVAAYAGNDLVNEGKTFKFWSTDGTTEVTFPVTADANLTFVAVWDDAAVEPIAVTIGGDADNPLPAGTEPITVDATDGFTLRFAAKQVGVTYILQSATTVNGTFADVEVGGKAVSVTPEAVDEVVELTDPDTASTVKFFRVKVVVAE